MKIDKASVFFKNKILLFTLTVVFALSFLGFSMINTNGNNKVLKVAYPRHWGSIIPFQQSTVYGAGILGNQYEPLIQIGKDGSIEPLAAKSWSISNDYITYIFKIDTSRKFSNGVHLNAMHFKRAWEYGLIQEKKSHNISTLDGLYNLKGIDDFYRTGEISGIEVQSDDTLTIRFIKPYRQALRRLSGSRFSAFIIENNHFLGTGRYIIKADTADQNILHFDINPFHAEKNKLQKIELSVLDHEKAQGYLKEGKIHIYDFAPTSIVSNCNADDNNIECEFGQETAHEVVSVNGLAGRTFHNKKFRWAIQSMIGKIIRNKKNFEDYYMDSFRVDPQVYLPLQQGVLPEEEVDALIQQGDQYIDDLIEHSRKHPIYYATTGNNLKIKDELAKAGLTFNENSGKVEWKKALEMIYKTSELDLYLGSISVVSGDPDGLYHAVGRNGAILSPMEYRESVAEYYEEGRTIIDPKEIHSHYQQASREILTQVPFVHIGFKKDIVLYRKDLIDVDFHAKDRNDHKLHSYRLK